MAQYLVPEESRMNIHETLLATKGTVFYDILWMAKTRFNPSQTFFFFVWQLFCDALTHKWECL